jgi:hypothetical protein
MFSGSTGLRLNMPGAGLRAVAWDEEVRGGREGTVGTAPPLSLNESNPYRSRITLACSTMPAGSRESVSPGLALTLSKSWKTCSPEVLKVAPWVRYAAREAVQDPASTATRTLMCTLPSSVGFRFWSSTRTQS